MCCGNATAHAPHCSKCSRLISLIGLISPISLPTVSAQPTKKGPVQCTSPVNTEARERSDSRPLRGGTFAARVLELHRDVLPGTETKWRYRNMPAGATRRRVGIKNKKIPHSQVRSTAASAAARTDGERGPRKIPRSPAANAAGTRAPWANPPSLKLRRAGGGDFLGIKILNPDNRNPLHLPDQ